MTTRETGESGDDTVSGIGDESESAAGTRRAGALSARVVVALAALLVVAILVAPFIVRRTVRYYTDGVGLRAEVSASRLSIRARAIFIEREPVSP